MKIKEILAAQSVLPCTPETKFPEAIKSMKVSNCGTLPVVDNDYKVIGMITDRDICISLAEPNPQAWEQRRVGDIMIKNIHTVRNEDEVSTAFQSMRKNQNGKLPVVDNFGKLNGVLSLHNLIDLSVNGARKESWDITTPGENLLKTVHAVTGRYNNIKSTTPTNY